MPATYLAVEVTAPGIFRLVERAVAAPGAGQVRFALRPAVCVTRTPRLWKGNGPV